MQYIVMFTLCVFASVVDIITGILKAHITNSYDSTIMKAGLYSKATNWLVMAFAIGCEIGMEFLGRYYDNGSEIFGMTGNEVAKFGGAIAAGTVFIVIMLMEAISIFENFAVANPHSPIAKIFGKRLKKFQDAITEKEENK